MRLPRRSPVQRSRPSVVNPVGRRRRAPSSRNGTEGILNTGRCAAEPAKGAVALDDPHASRGHAVLDCACLLVTLSECDTDTQRAIRIATSEAPGVVSNLVVADDCASSTRSSTTDGTRQDYYNRKRGGAARHRRVAHRLGESCRVHCRLNRCTDGAGMADLERCLGAGKQVTWRGMA